MFDSARRSIYAELQDFVQLELREPLRKAIRNKKDLIRLTNDKFNFLGLRGWKSSENTQGKLRSNK